jgi:hypothetical protein
MAAHPLLEPNVVLHMKTRGDNVEQDSYTTIEQAVEGGKIGAQMMLADIRSHKDPNTEVWRHRVWAFLGENINDYTIDGLKKKLHKLLQPNLYTQLGPGMFETTVIVGGHKDDSATSAIVEHGRGILDTIYGSLELGSV